MQPNSSPAPAPATPPADDKPNYATSNDLDFEMSQEDEQAFINEQLGIEGGVAPDAPEDAPQDTPPETPTEEPTEPETPTEAPTGTPPEPPEEPEQVDTTIQTDDLWIEVDRVVVDDDGNEKTEKIKLVFDPEDPSTFIPDDFRFKSDKQLADILEAKQEMASLYKERKSEVDEKLKTIEESKSIQEKKETQLATWDSEIERLISRGLIDAPKAKAGDPKFLEDPGVKKIDEVFKYMAAANDELAKEGKPPITSFALAFTEYQNDAAQKAEAEAKEKEIADTKARGALIGGASSASTTTERPSYRAGSAGNIWEVEIPD